MEEKKKGIWHNISAIGKPALYISAPSSAIKELYRFIDTALKYELCNLKCMNIENYG